MRVRRTGCQRARFFTIVCTMSSNLDRRRTLLDATLTEVKRLRCCLSIGENCAGELLRLLVRLCIEEQCSSEDQLLVCTNYSSTWPDVVLVKLKSQRMVWIAISNITTVVYRKSHYWTTVAIPGMCSRELPSYVLYGRRHSFSFNWANRRHYK